MPTNLRKVVSVQGGGGIVNHCAIANLLGKYIYYGAVFLVRQGPLGKTWRS